jgi:hypothetical protein
VGAKGGKVPGTAASVEAAGGAAGGGCGVDERRRRCGGGDDAQGRSGWRRRGCRGRRVAQAHAVEHLWTATPRVRKAVGVGSNIEQHLMEMTILTQRLVFQPN